jgi:hypothetical protein
MFSQKAPNRLLPSYRSWLLPPGPRSLCRKAGLLVPSVPWRAAARNARLTLWGSDALMDLEALAVESTNRRVHASALSPCFLSDQQIHRPGPNLNWRLRMRCASSMPARVTAAVR